MAKKCLENGGLFNEGLCVAASWLRGQPKPPDPSHHVIPSTPANGIMICVTTTLLLQHDMFRSDSWTPWQVVFCSSTIQRKSLSSNFRGSVCSCNAVKQESKQPLRQARLELNARQVSLPARPGWLGRQAIRFQWCRCRNTFTRNHFCTSNIVDGHVLVVLYCVQSSASCLSENNSIVCFLRIIAFLLTYKLLNNVV